MGEQLDNIVTHQRPDRIDAERGAEREHDKIQKAKYQNQNARPFLSLEKPNPADEPGYGSHG